MEHPDNPKSSTSHHLPSNNEVQVELVFISSNAGGEVLLIDTEVYPPSWYQARLLEPYREPSYIDCSELSTYRTDVVVNALGREVALSTYRPWLYKQSWLKHEYQPHGHEVNCSLCKDSTASFDTLRFGVCGHTAHLNCWNNHVQSMQIDYLTCFAETCQRNLAISADRLFHGSWLRPGPREHKVKQLRELQKRARRKARLKEEKQKAKAQETSS